MESIKEESNFSKTSNMPRQKPVYPGDTVIFVHDTEDYKEGDRAVVVGICPGCRGFIVEGSHIHHKRENINLFIKSEPIKLDRQLLFSAITNVHAKLFFNTQQGIIAADTVKEILKGLYSDMGITEDYFKNLH